MSRKFIAIIPARFQSSRFPGKPLSMIGDKTMIERVYEQTLKVKSFSKVIVATDDDRIFDYCFQKKIEVAKTSTNHLNGTTRCLEVANAMQLNGNDVIINIQGDEPFISPNQIELVISCFDKLDVQIASLCKQIISDVENPNIVKVVKNKFSEAIYFSRSVIPYRRDNDFNPEYFKHIGLYGYRYNVLKEIVLIEESDLERAEKLEQLRWLENGYKVQLNVTTDESLSVDTPQDLLLANEYLKKLSWQ